jgi:hypothetical protein
MHFNKFVAFMVIASLSITLHIVIIIFYLRFGSQTAYTTQLICMLHVSSLIQNVANLPNVYLGNLQLCQFMGALRYFGGLGMVCVLFLISLAFYNFLHESENIRFTLKKGRFVVLFFPFIAFLPYTTNSYSEYAGSWCTLSTGDFTSDLWAFSVMYFWACLTLFVSTTIFFYVIIITYVYDIHIRENVFNALGGYIVFSWIYVIPHVVTRFVLYFRTITSDTDQFLTEISSYLCGIGLSLISYYCRDLFRKYEHHMVFTLAEITFSLISALSSIHSERPSSLKSVEISELHHSDSTRLYKSKNDDIESISRISSETETVKNPCIQQHEEAKMP